MYLRFFGDINRHVAIMIMSRYCLFIDLTTALHIKSRNSHRKWIFI